MHQLSKSWKLTKYARDKQRQRALIYLSFWLCHVFMNYEANFNIFEILQKEVQITSISNNWSRANKLHCKA